MKRNFACDPLFPQVNVEKLVRETLRVSQNSIKLKISELNNKKEKGGRKRRSSKKKI